MFKPKNTQTLSVELEAEKKEILKSVGEEGYAEKCAAFNAKLASAGVSPSFFLSGK